MSIIIIITILAKIIKIKAIDPCLDAYLTDI